VIRSQGDLTPKFNIDFQFKNGIYKGRDFSRFKSDYNVYQPEQYKVYIKTNKNTLVKCIVENYNLH